MHSFLHYFIHSFVVHEGTCIPAHSIVLSPVRYVSIYSNIHSVKRMHLWFPCPEVRGLTRIML